MQADGEVVAGHFTRDSAQDERLATAGWAIDQNAAAGFAAVGLVQIRELQRVGDLEADLLLQLLHAADIGKGDTTTLRVAGRVEGFRPPVIGRIIEGIVEELILSPPLEAGAS
jgi:hypothetical protein